MINEITKLANALDKMGYHKEADQLDLIIKESHRRSPWGSRKYEDLWGRDDYKENDEGFHYRHCSSCGCKTEHESTPAGNVCISCDDKAREKLTRKKKDD